MIETIEQLRAAVYGQAVGDALGVPYEFQDRDSFACANMIGHGTHNQPAGTWSDDTSMMLATLDSLIDRPLWTQWDKAFVEPDGDEHYPATFLWASNFNSTVSFDTVAAQYGSQSSSIARIRQDHMTLDMRRIHEHANVSAIVDKLVKQAWPKVGNGDNPHDAWAKADTAMLPYLAGGKEPDLG